MQKLFCTQSTALTQAAAHAHSHTLGTHTHAQSAAWVFVNEQIRMEKTRAKNVRAKSVAIRTLDVAPTTTDDRLKQNQLMPTDRLLLPGHVEP